MTLYHSKKKKGGTPGGWMSSFIDDLFNAQQGLCFHCAQPMTRRQDQERGWRAKWIAGMRKRYGHILPPTVVLAQVLKTEAIKAPTKKQLMDRR